MSTLGVILVVFDLSCDILKSSGGVDLDKLLDMSNQDAWQMPEGYIDMNKSIWRTKNHDLEISDDCEGNKFKTT